MNLATNLLQNQPEDAERIPPNICNKCMHHKLDSLSMGGGREASLSHRPESGSSDVGRHALDGIFGNATWVRWILIEDHQSCRSFLFFFARDSEGRD